MIIGVARQAILLRREHRPPRAPSADDREERLMWSDLAALTPPLVVCIAFLIGLVMFLRREMSPKRRAERDAKRRPPGPRS